MALSCPTCHALRQYKHDKAHNYYCVRCATTFKEDGKVVKRGKFMTCPSCNRASTRFIKSMGCYCCSACGSEFNSNSSFVTKRNFHPCPQCNNKTTNYVFSQNLYRCHRCGTEYKEGFSIVARRNAQPCVVCSNRYTSYSFEKDEYFCSKCGSVFSTRGKIITKRIPQVCPSCSSGNTRFSFRNKKYSCDRCGTYFTEEGIVTELQKYFPCPVCKTDKSYYRKTEGNLVCPKYGTIYLSPTKIIKIGSAQRCPLCSNGSTLFRLSSDNYICHRCGTVFLKNREIISGQLLFYCPKCNKKEVRPLTNPNSNRCDRCGSEVDVIAIEKRLDAEIREFYLKSLKSLQVRGMDDKSDEFAQFYWVIKNKIQKDTKYRSLRKLGPILLYFFLKTRGILLVLPDFLRLYQTNYSEFITDINSVAKFYPEFHERDKRFIIKAYIASILKSLNRDERIISQAFIFFDHFYPIIQHTKEELIAAVTCVLVKIWFDFPDIYVRAISLKGGVRQSSLIRVFRVKIFPYLGIPKNASLKYSFDAIKKETGRKFSSLGIVIKEPRFPNLGRLLEERKTSALCEKCGYYIYAQQYEEKKLFVCKHCLEREK